MKRINITPKAYHDLKFDQSKLPDVAAAGPVSASILSKSRDPLLFLLGTDKEQTADMQWGSLVDTMWTEPHGVFVEQYIVLPEDAPQRPTEAMLKAAKPTENSLTRQKWWAEFEERSCGKTVITHQQFMDARSAISMLNQNALAREMWEASDKQVALVGDSPILPGTQAKCLFDLLPTSGPFVDAIVDLKTSGLGMADNLLVKTMWRFDYVVKLAYYGILAEAAGLGERPRGILIWQNSSFPWECHVREIDPADMALGRQVAINRVNALTRIDPSKLHLYFDTSLRTISLPDWCRTAYMER
jgi:hypothetical protein